MKSIISEISDSFYTKIIDNDYFSAFFIDKDFDHINNMLQIIYIILSHLRKKI